MGKLITTLLEWALFFGITGGLVDVTYELRHEAARAHAIGLVSLSQLNRQLVGHPRPRRDRKR